MASCRLQGFHVDEFFRECGVDSRIVATDFITTHPNYSLHFLRFAKRLCSPSAADVLLFERPNWMAFKLSQICRMNGIRTIAIRCDLLPGRYDEYFDLTVVPTEELATALKLTNYVAIEDLIEVPEETFKRSYERSQARLQLVWVGHPGYRNFILGFSEALLAHPALRDQIDIRTISKGPWATRQWALDTVYDSVLEADIAMLPLPAGERFSIKSSNRMSMLMALGMPLVATPIPSYTKIAESGINCLLASTIDEFAAAIKQLESEQARRQLGVAGRTLVRARFAKKQIGNVWLQTVSDVARRPCHEVVRPSLSTRLAKLAVSLL